MVNSRKFNEEQVLDKILHMFWRKGYEATTLDDLITATGVKRQSLYNAFGNKDAMFLKSYKRYLNHINETMMRAANDDNAPLPQRVRAILDAFTDVVIDLNTPAGCLITNSTVEFGDQDNSSIAFELKQHFQEIEDSFYNLLKQAKREGRLNKDKKPRAMAQFFVATMTSIAMIYRLNKNKKFVKNVLNQAMYVLD